MNLSGPLIGGLVVVSFLAGRYLLPSPDSGITGITEEELALVRSKKEITPSVRRRRSGESQSERREKLPSEEVASALYQDLLISDQFEAQRAIFNRLSEMDSSNWRDVFDQFKKVTEDTGIRHDDIWPKVLVRVGQVAGAEALNFWIEEDVKRNEYSIIQAMWGWAMKDPQAAAQFYHDKIDLDSELRKKLLSRVVGGMALSEPDQLISFVADLPEDIHNHTVGHTLPNLMKGHGVDRASRWLDEVQRGNFSEKMKWNSFQRVGQAVIKNISGVGGPTGMEWFRRYGKSPMMNTSLITQAASSFQHENAIQALDFLKMASDFPALEESQSDPAGLNTAIRKSAKHDSSQVETWLEENRDTVFFQAAANSYANYLLEVGDTEGAAHWQNPSSE